MDRLLAELQRPLHAKLLQTIREAYKNSGDDLELFGSTSLQTLKSLPGYNELLGQQLCAAGVVGCVPDAEVSAAAKEAAKAHFICDRYGEACQSYTRALQTLHESSAGSIDVKASNLYSDRALCLLRLVPPAAEAAYADCTAAIACNSANHKAWYRRALASEVLGRHDAIEDAREADRLMTMHGWSSPQLKTLLQRLTESLPATTPSNIASECLSRAVIDLQQGVSECQLDAETVHGPSFDTVLAAAAPGLSVRISEGTGRYLIASQELNAGSIIIEECPFVAVLAKSQRSKSCSVCFEALPLNPVYCRSCPVAAYCSCKCRAADAYHVEGGPECTRPWPLLLSDDARLALRLAAKLAKDGDSNSGNSRAQQVLSLEHHWGKAPLLAALPAILLACLAYSCWTNRSSGMSETQRSLQNSDDLIGAVTIGAVIRALGQVAVNGVAIVPRSHANATGRKGLALYPVVSMMNHACVPATQLDWQGLRLVARTLKNLQPGDEVSLTYGPQLGSMITSVRRNLLQRQYHFTCLCDACESPPDSELDMVGLACLKEGCPGAIAPSRACSAGLLSIEDLPAKVSSSGVTSCPICHKCYLREEETLDELEACAGHFDAAMQTLANMGVKVSTSQQASISSTATTTTLCQDQIISCLKVRRGLLHSHNELIGFTENALADSIAATSRQWLEAADAYSRSIDVMRAAYPANSITVAFQQMKYSSLLRKAGKGEAAEKQMAEAHFVFTLHFGNTAAMD